MENQINKTLGFVCGKGVEEGVCSGVSAAVSVVRNQVRYRGFFGCGATRSDHLAQRVNETTVFDLASLTKPLCTTLCTLALVDAGLFTFESTCFFKPDTNDPSEKREISIRNILRHASGLPSYQPYFKKFKPCAAKDNTQRLLELILAEPMTHPPGSHSLYSDLGFILLGRFIEQSAQQTLDRFFCQTITKPLHLNPHLRFLPIGTVEKREQETIAATESCPWRHKVLQGEVHDEHCWLMGGVAGHAGLFGTAEGVLRLCERLLDCWQERERHPAFSNNLLRQALTWRDGSDLWALGFNRPTPGDSSSGRYFSANSVGHLGFSGTSFWIDPDQNLIVVLLTNRVHPSRENMKIRKFRPFFHDYLLEKSGITRC